MKIYLKYSQPTLQNGNEGDANCKGIDGVMETYLNILKTVDLMYPTNFAPSILKCATSVISWYYRWFILIAFLCRLAESAKAQSK